MRNWSIGTLLLWLAFAPLAQAFYNPSTGTWLNRDPIENYVEPNKYAFAMNSPGKFIDPDGRESADMFNFDLDIPTSFLPQNPSEPPPGFGESLIPVYGAYLNAEYNINQGNVFTGVFYETLAISDVFLVRSIATGLGKGCWKVGSHSWSATRAWYGRTRELFKNQEVHHAILNQNQGIGKWFPEWFKNQPWNFVAVPELVRNGVKHTSKTVHLAIHGISRRLKLEWYERAWYGTPDWVKEVSLYFGLRAETVFEEDCECSAKHAGKTVIKEGNNEVVLP